jgi:hypothetical protein
MQSLDAWTVDQLRLTLFHQVGDLPNNFDDEWRKLTGEEPESQTIKKTGDRMAVGPFAEGRLFLHTTPGRIDWVLSTMTIAETKPAMLFSPTVDVFSAAISSWLKSHPFTLRLAFGAALRRQSLSEEDACMKASEYLPFDLDPKNSADFAYQINRRRNSKVFPSLKINRLAKWSVVQFVAAIVAVELPLRLGQSQVLPAEFHCQLELDINTAQEPNEVFPQDRVPELFGELVNLGREIACDGDKP